MDAKAAVTKVTAGFQPDMEVLNTTATRTYQLNAPTYNFVIGFFITVIGTLL